MSPATRNHVWQPIEARVHADQPSMQKMLPVWSLTAVYDQPDGQVEVPIAYRAEHGASQWFAQHSSSPLPDRTWYFFENRHLDVRYQAVHRPSRRDSPRPLSQTHGEAGRDWDHVMQTRDRILADAGLDASAPAVAIARAIAHAVYTHWRGGGPRNHPADVLTHRSWCAGAANATIAMLESLGIPARLVYTMEHAVCEAWLQDSWWIIDSSNHFINHPPGSVSLLPSDFMTLTTSPVTAAMDSGISDFHRAVFYHYGCALYGPPDGRWFNEAQHRLCPAFARAYYPHLQSFRFKTQDPTRLVVMDRSDRVMGQTPWLPGQTLRESVYLGDLSEVRTLEWEMALMPGHDRALTPADLQQLVWRINGKRVKPRAVQNALSPGPYKSLRWKVGLPVGAFEPQAVNWVTIQNQSCQSGLCIALNVAALEPYLPPLCHG